jgi:hypothetical protein
MARIFEEFGIASATDQAEAFQKEREAQRRREQRRRERKALPKLVRGLDEPGIPETVGSRLMHRLFPRRKARLLLQKSLIDKS